MTMDVMLIRACEAILREILDIVSMDDISVGSVNDLPKTNWVGKELPQEPW